jgi:hypothetical protein
LAKKDLAHDKDDLLIWLVSDDIFKIFGLTSKQHIRNKSQISWNITGVEEAKTSITDMGPVPVLVWFL